MRIRTALLVTAITLLLGAHLRAQETVDKPGPAPKRIVAGLETKETPANRKQALEEVRAMPNRVLRFQDSELKIRTIIGLANALWGKDKDESEARLLFLKADELIRSVRISKDNEPAIRQEKDRDVVTVTPVSPSVLRNLKILLVQRVTFHDATLGQRLSREYGLGDGSPADIAYQDSFAVSGMITRGQTASATKALQNRINDGFSGRMPFHGFLQLLLQLRAQDAQAADGLFTEAMLRISGQPNVTANDVLVMGNYLFASRSMSATLLRETRLFTTSKIQLGDVLVEADVAQVRPGNSPAAIGAYLGSATQLLGRGSYDPEETKRRAAAAYLLLPHAQAFAPEFVPQLLAIQRGPGLDFSVRRPDPLPLTENGKLDLKAMLESVDAIPTSKLRDQYILSAVRKLYLTGDLDAALAVAEKAEDLKAHNQLVGVVTFARAAKSLEEGQIEIAEKSLNRVTSTLQRFLLRLGMARLYLKQRDEPAAGALVNVAIKDIRDHADDLEKPYLILAAVQLLASFDLPVAIDGLRDAIKAFNALEPPRKARAGASLLETITFGDTSATFQLRISLVKFESLGATLKSLSSDPQGVRVILFELKDERILSEAMIAFAHTLLR